MFSRLLSQLPSFRTVCGGVILCAAWLMSANVAWATCGDYLDHSEVIAQTQPSPSQMPAPQRCTGPQCRQTPLAPDAPAAPITIVARFDRGIWRRDPFVHEVAAAVATRLGAEPDARPVTGVEIGVDHIPRSV